jgi:uncharacterized protein YbjT (DUF2867 family)
VRAITRHPESPPAKQLATLGARIVQADMGEVDTLIRAFEGVHGVFSVQNFWELGLREEVRLGTNVIEAAQRVGNPHVVYSSGLGAERRQGVAAIDGKAMLEERLRQSGLPFTIIRPALFMDDFLGAALPFARPLQKRLDSHRSLVGRLFLATLRAVAPRNSRIPLTTLHDVARMADWTFDHPDRAQGRAYEVLSSTETTETLCALWERMTGQSIPAIPALRLGIHLGHPKMASLLDWLSQQMYIPKDLPVPVTRYEAWLRSKH